MRPRYLVSRLESCSDFRLRIVLKKYLYEDSLRKVNFMKDRKFFVLVIVVLSALLLNHGLSIAKTNTEVPASRVGVVSVRQIFQDSKRNMAYREKVSAEQDTLIKEFDKLKAELELANAGLNTLKPDSAAYMEQVNEILQIQAKLQVKQEFYKQKLAMKDRRWTETLYRDILRVTAEVASEKGLDMVLEKSEPELPSPNADELVSSIRTHKLMYAGGCIDITQQVMARVDQRK